MLAVMTCNAQSVQIFKDGQLMAEFYQRDGWEFVFNGIDPNNPNNPNNPNDQEIIHDYIDLGLPSGLKWATENVGATRPTEYGDYFAWGEVEAKQNFNWWPTYFDAVNAEGTEFYKYDVDKKRVLDPEDDAAHVKWGGDWRMPTIMEFQELSRQCRWDWTTIDGVDGFNVTGPNGNTIFLPAAGAMSDVGPSRFGEEGNYMTSNLYVDPTTGGPAVYNYFYTFDNTLNRGPVAFYRFLGYTIRPVCE